MDFSNLMGAIANLGPLPIIGAVLVAFLLFWSIFKGDDDGKGKGDKGGK